MSVKALQEYTRFSKYAKYVPEKKRRESWEEQVSRVFQMHRDHLGEAICEQLNDELEFAEKMVRKKRVLGSQRALQFGGSPILDKNQRLYNCVVSYCDRPRFFQEGMHLLLCGCGIGFSVQKRHTENLPNITVPTKGEKIFVVEDSIEGWADAIGVIVSSYFVGDKVTFPEYQGYDVEFDYSQVRPAGAPISSGSKAPGPDGLKASIIKIEKLLGKCCKFGDKLRPIDAYDIMMHTSDAVLSGGVRRSATICLFSADDEEMAKAKTGSWFIDNPQRGRSNNSVLLIRDETSKDDFGKFMGKIKEFGEPGFVWAENSDVVYNPCVEIGMCPKLPLTPEFRERFSDEIKLQDADDSLSGWEFCFTGDTKVLTEDGYVPIRELSGKSANVVSMYSSDTQSYREDQHSKLFSAHIVETGVKPVFELKIRNGQTLRLTDNHSVLTKSGYKEVKDLNMSDKLIMVNECNRDSEKAYDEKEYIPNHMDLLGWNLGDGWCCGDQAFGLVFGSKEDDYAEKLLGPLFSDLIEETDGGPYGNRYGTNVCFKEKEGVRSYSTCNSSKRKVICEKYGIKVATAHDKRLMSSYWMESRENKARYLSALFSADGSVINKEKSKYISLTMSNEDLATDVQLALTEFGICSRLNHHKRKRDGKNQSLLIIKNQNDVCIFNSFIGFRLHPRKQSDLNSIEWVKKGTTERGLFSIESIKYVGDETVYDMTVDESHNFVANGMVVHNCNLCEINMKKAKTEEDFLDACRSAAILGTIQASYTRFDYLGGVSEEIVKMEALLGVSMTGMADSPEVAFSPASQRKGAKLILEVNERLSKIIGINKCARATCIKPAGSTSCVLGTASGIHPHHAKRYFRRVQANKLETPLQYFTERNPDAVEESVWSNNNTDMVITFLCEVPDGAKTKNQVGALALLENVKLTQQNWVEYGTRHDIAIYPWLRHNVSNTINVKPDEWDEVEAHIYKNKKWYAGISMIPMSGDKDYPQAPFTSVSTPTEMVREYGNGCMFASGLIVDGLRAFEDNLWAGSDCVLGIGEIITVEPLRLKIKKDFETNGVKWKNEGLSPDSPRKLLHAWLKHNVVNYEQKSDWVRRAKQFADRYFEGDERKMTYCLKDVVNWKRWCDLKRTYVEVDWSGCYEDEYGNLDNYGGGAAEACAGGFCEMGELGASMRESLGNK